ncbi:MAG: MBL fold metallo-hydrolase [bacterium]|nr:MBL fold metallo-hydrolase [bacterium]
MGKSWSTEKINGDTTLIDIGMYSVKGITAVYLIKGENKTCLIDGGTKEEASNIIAALKELGEFPPDIIIPTHSHFDHCQAIPAMRKKAAKEQKTITVMASEAAVPLLADQSYNEVLVKGPHPNITDVEPLKEGDTLDLGGIVLEFFNIPGHHKDHLAILDKKNKNIFVGDAIGYKVAGKQLPPFVAPFWDKDSYYSTIKKLKKINYSSLCLAHFGVLRDKEAKNILDRSLAAFEAWWKIFEENEDRVDDADFMLETVMKETNLVPPELEIVSFKLKIAFALMTGWSKLTHKKPKTLFELLMLAIMGYLSTGYKTYKKL